MRISLFTFVDLYERAVDTGIHLLAKGVDFAERESIAEAEMLGWRLVEDMQPLRFQLSVVANFAAQWPARIAGVPAPADVRSDLSAAELHRAMGDAKTFLSALRPEQFEGRDDVPLSFKIGDGMQPEMPAGQWLTVFATTNLYFHLSTAYGILRAKGVPIGKVDIFANRL